MQDNVLVKNYNNYVLFLAIAYSCGDLPGSRKMQRHLL